MTSVSNNFIKHRYIINKTEILFKHIHRNWNKNKFFVRFHTTDMKASRKKIWKTVLIVMLILILITMITATVWFFVTYYSVRLDEDTVMVPSRNLIVTDSENREIPINSVLNKYVRYDEINVNIVNAFIATEDKRFFRHNGVDYKRLVGAMAHNIKAGYWKEGGSTITQQLIKNTQLSSEKSLTRKVKEMHLAHQIEKKYSKEEIIEMYLNAIYFGNGIYGIDEACRQYFGKTPDDITISEAAVLAGVVKNPRKNSLLNSVENANARKNLVLRLMREQDMIDETEYNEAIDFTVIPAVIDDSYRPYSSYIDAVLNEASEILGVGEKELIEGNYRIMTYLDAQAQERIYKGFQSEELLPKNQNNVAPSYGTVSLNRENAGVSVYVSDLKQSIFDFRRQPGSAIKPFLSYLPAIENLSYCSLTSVDDTPISIGGYAPKNYHNSYLGKVPLKKAVASSSNAVAVRLTSEVGLNAAKDLASRAGITFSANDNTLPIALGGMSDGVTLLELTAAYSAISNGGIYTKPSFIKAIFDRNDKTIYQRQIKKTQAFSRESAALMTEMLEYTVSEGTAKKLSALGSPVAAKTGTVGREGGGNNDAWCAAYTSENTALSWYGNLSLSSDSALTDSLTGGSYPAIVATEVLKSVQKTPSSEFPIPYTVVEAEIDKEIYETSGEFYLVPDTFPDDMKLKGLFKAVNAPKLFSPNAIIAEPENFDISIYLYPYITFFAKENETYRIYRQNGFEENFIKEIAGENSLTQTADADVSRGSFITYRIEVVNRAGLKDNFYRSVFIR